MERSDNRLSGQDRRQGRPERRERIGAGANVIEVGFPERERKAPSPDRAGGGAPVFTLALVSALLGGAAGFSAPLLYPLLGFGPQEAVSGAPLGDPGLAKRVAALEANKPENLDADLSALKAELAAAKAKLAEFEAGLSLAPNGPAAFEPLARRLAALEGAAQSAQDGPPAPEQLARGVAALQARVGLLEETGRDLSALDKRIAALETKAQAQVAQPAAAPAIAPEDIAALNEKIRALEAKQGASASAGAIAALERDIAQLRAAQARAGVKPGISSGQAAQAAFAVAGALEAAKKPGPFERAYAQLAAALPGDPNVAALEPLSRKGAPTRIELRAEFPEVEDAILKAVKASQPKRGFFESLGEAMSAKKPGEGDGPRDLVVRASRKLAADDLGGAIGELSRLTGLPAEMAEPWLEKARARHEIDQRLAAIRADLTRRN